jgi:hypothetical protein
MINALKYVEELEQTGFTSEQAKISVTTWIELMNDNLATKNEMREISNKIDSLNKEFVIQDKKLEIMESRLVIKLGSILLGGMAILEFIIKN